MNDNLIILVDNAFQKEKHRLYQFFQSKGFDINEAEKLSHAMKRAVFFLKTHEFERHNIELSFRKKEREKLKKELRDTKRASKQLSKSFPVFDWESLYQIKKTQIENHEFIKTRAGKNKSLELALQPLFWRLHQIGMGQVKQVNLVYDLFVEFELDDYGKTYSTENDEIGEKEQKERIRKQFQQKAIKSYSDYAT